MEPVWGIDLGGTKIEGVILRDSQNIEVLHRLRIPTEKEKGYEHIIHQIELLLSKLTAASGLKPERIGIATPGTIDPHTTLMKNSNTTCLNGRPFREDVEKQLGIPVKMANDANCFAIAEANLGVVKEHLPHAQLVFGVIMGTGVGGGIVFNGKVWNGSQGIAGEWGHSFLDDSGGSCYCGDVGCTETILSGPALEEYYQKISGQSLSLKAITERHKAGTDEFATKTIDRLLHFFAKGIANIINVLDPDAIVLGGGVGNIDLLYTEGVARIQPFIFNHKVNTLFLKPKLGDSAGVFGAALLVA
ncbi:MAG: ROK family protein [Saprospiraceae bacterium]